MRYNPASLNVLHLITGRGPTGPAASAMSDVSALLAAGKRGFLASGDGSALPESCAEAGIPCLGGLKLGRGPLRLLRLPHDLRHLRAMLREYAIDVLHVHRADDQLLAAAALGRQLSVKLIRTWHRDPRALPRPLLAKLAAQADGCVCVAREHADALRGAGAPAAEYIPVAVDTDVFKPSAGEQGGDPAAAAPLDSGGMAAFRIGQVGRWKRERDGRDRGQRAALDVFEHLSKRQVNAAWTGLLIGRGEAEDELRREATNRFANTDVGQAGETPALPAERQVALLRVEKQSSAGFAAVLGSLHIGLLFTPGSDGTSRAGAELLACGVPILAADLPGLRELAEDSSCALRQLAGDPAGWAAAIEKLLNQPELLTQMSLAARRRAHSAHALEVRGRALVEFYSR